jgi:hypothetical protein
MSTQINPENVPPRFRWWLAATAVEMRLGQLARALKSGFNPDQPRDERGRWTDNGSSGNDTVASVIATAELLILAGGPLSYQKCLDLCYPLLERFTRVPGSDRNETDFHKCMNVCMGRNL